MSDILYIESQLVKKFKEVYDPEIPVNIYELGLIYDVDVQPSGMVIVTMTLTAPNCPVADDLVAEVKEKVELIEGVTEAHIDLVFDPPWDESRMSEEARYELGFL